MSQDFPDEAISAEFRSAGGENEGKLAQAQVPSAKSSSDPQENRADQPIKTTEDTLDAMEFRQSIANWFGPKGFNAMRSFFRSSVLNTLQFEKIGQKHKKRSNFEIAIALLMADHLMTAGCNFTMSVFIAEVLKPLAHQHQIVKILIQRIGRSAIFERILSKEDVSFVLTSLNIDSFSESGVGVLNSYCHGDGLDLLSVLLKPNPPVQDLSLQRGNSFKDDVTAAYSEGIREEVEKFRCWFAEFSSQFADTTMTLREMCRVIRGRSSSKLVEAGNHDGKVSKLWDKVSSIVDEQLREKDEERRKLAVYAKQLDSLRREMNVKLDAVRNYENILKAKENALNELFGENLIFRDEKETNFHGERGDFVKYSNSIGARCDRRCFPAGDFSTGFDESQNGKFSIAGKSNLSEENDRLKFESRQQRLKIDVLTRRCTALELALGKNTVTPNLQISNTFRQEAHQQISNTFRQEAPVCRHPTHKLVEPLERTVTTARNELNRLKEDQLSADLHYQLLLNWK